MTMIYSKENTQKLHRVITAKVFVCAHGEDDSCAIIEKVDEITPDILDRMKSQVDAKIVKVISTMKDFNLLKPGLDMVFDEVKFVQRETSYEVMFQASPPILRATKEVKEENIVDINKTVKVLVVDDSTTICNLLKKIMGLSTTIEVVDTINDPLDAEAAIEKYKPDVVTLDIHMPNMNGVELLKKIQPKYKIPCIMISSISIQEGPLVLEALDSGAVDYIQKPDMSNFAAIANEINQTIIAASKVKKKAETRTIKKVYSGAGVDLDNNLIVIGASTGGTKALKDVIDSLPSEIPPTLIVQHIPAEFSKAFADRLNESVSFTVKEARDGDRVIPNQILVAPGGKQMKFKNTGDIMSVEINDDEPVNRFKPSVDYLFDSVANSNIDKNIVAAIFTGMGRDGAKGMLNLKNAKNAKTIAQNEETCVVFGMPKEAIKLGCVDNIVSLEESSHALIDSCVAKLANQA